VQAGIAVDTRDNEPSPTRGFFVDASVRGAAPFTGSASTFGGGNVTARLYAPLLPSRALVVADRVIADVVFGDAPVRERMRFGGLVELSGLGGQDTARGVRLSRYPGRLRLSHQIELRADVAHIDIGGNDLGLVVAGFVDGGLALFGGDVDDDARLLIGTGVALRVIWNENFVFRIDLAVSPEEPGRVGFYTAPNHPF
jgi:outer membrane protein assembly factor BamA